MSMNKAGTCQLWIDGKHVANVSLDKTEYYEQAVEQYKEDENLGRLLWLLDGVKVKKDDVHRSVVCVNGACTVKLEKNLFDGLQLQTISYNLKGESYFENIDHFAKYGGQRKGKSGYKKYPINKRNY